VALEVVEPRRPHPAIGRKPLVDGAQRSGAHAVQTALRVTAHLDEARLAKDPQMLGHRRLAQLEPLNQLPNGSLGVAEQVQDAAAVRLRHDVEHQHETSMPDWLYNCQGIFIPVPKCAERRTLAVVGGTPAESRKQDAVGPTGAALLVASCRGVALDDCRANRTIAVIGGRDRILREPPASQVERVMYLTAAVTGMRQGELFGLRWRDVDSSARRIRVRRNYVRGEFGTPKSKRSSRSVPLASRVAAELELLFQGSPYKRHDDLVLAHPETGKPIDRSKLLKRSRPRSAVQEVAAFASMS
jgi:hypothetical protein